MFRTEDSQILGAVITKFSRHSDLTPGICAPLHHLLHGLLYGLFPRALPTKFHCLHLLTIIPIWFNCHSENYSCITYKPNITQIPVVYINLFISYLLLLSPAQTIQHPMAVYSYSLQGLSCNRCTASSKGCKSNSSIFSFPLCYPVAACLLLLLLPPPPLPHLLIPSIFASKMCFRRQFICKMWPIQLAFLHFTACRMLLSSLTLYNTSSFSHDRSIWWLPITSSPDNQEWEGLWNIALLPSAASWLHMRILILLSSASTHIWMPPGIIHCY
jgi:hypothetical protein